MQKHNKLLTPYAKNLRKNMTNQERKLWYECLRQYPIRMLRQKVVESYIIDFYCARVKLAIEIDGSDHYSQERSVADQLRTKELAKYGIEVIRFSNREIEDEFDGVCMAIDQRIKEILAK